ncbi:hypothetical protein HDU98_008683 [Podochytrium sp. JEL0797]|nr:hypothetical protein HDU98_008683 [Podochytrium sp. JEL0797]
MQVSHPTTTSHHLLVLDRPTKSLILQRALSPSDTAVETVSWLAETVKSSLPPTWRLKHLGTSNGISFPLKSQTLLHSLSLLSPDGVVTWVALVKWQQSSPNGTSGAIQIFVSLVGHIVVLYFNPSEKVEDVKKRIFETATGVPPLHEFYLAFGGKKLDEKESLEYAKVSKCSTLQVILRLRGGRDEGVCSFVDVSSSIGPRTGRFGQAPSWRSAGPGLNVLGECMNAACAAHLDSVVSPQGIGFFDILMDEHKVKCPECDSFVAPKECVLFACEYRFSGRKKNPETRQFVAFRSNWVTAPVGEAYHLFSEHHNGIAEWATLVIETKSVCESDCRDCGICCRGLANVVGLNCNECGRGFHEACGQTWMNAIGNICPACRVNGSFNGVE